MAFKASDVLEHAYTRVHRHALHCVSALHVAHMHAQCIYHNITGMPTYSMWTFDKNGVDSCEEDYNWSFQFMVAKRIVYPIFKCGNT